METGIFGTRNWRTWGRGIISSDDTLLTNYKPSEYDASKAIAVYPDTAIAARVYGRDTDNDTATLVISGWMDDGVAGGAGPGMVLWRGQVTLGAITFTEKPNDDEHWNATAAWFEVDTYDTSVTNGSNASSAIVQGGGNHSVLIVPTLGFVRLMFHVIDLGGANEMTELGILWRPCSKAGVI